MARVLDVGVQLRNQGLGSFVFIQGTKANVDTAAAAVGSDTHLCSQITFQVDPDNTSGIFFGSTAGQPIQLAPGQSYTIQAAQITDIEVKAQGSDTNITVNYLGTVV